MPSNRITLSAARRRPGRQRRPLSPPERRRKTAAAATDGLPHAARSGRGARPRPRRDVDRYVSVRTQQPAGRPVRGACHYADETVIASAVDRRRRRLNTRFTGDEMTVGTIARLRVPHPFAAAPAAAAAAAASATSLTRSLSNAQLSAASEHIPSVVRRGEIEPSSDTCGSSLSLIMEIKNQLRSISVSYSTPSSSPAREAEYIAISVTVCSHAYLRNHVSKLHPIFIHLFAKCNKKHNKITQLVHDNQAENLHLQKPPKLIIKQQYTRIIYGRDLACSGGVAI